MAVRYNREIDVVHLLNKQADEVCGRLLFDLFETTNSCPTFTEPVKRRLVSSEQLLPKKFKLCEVTYPQPLQQQFSTLATINDSIRAKQEQLKSIRVYGSKLEEKIQTKVKSSGEQPDILKKFQELKQRLKRKTDVEIQKMETEIQSCCTARDKIEQVYWESFYGARPQGAEESFKALSPHERLSLSNNKIKIPGTRGGTASEANSSVHDALQNVKTRDVNNSAPCNCRKSRCLKLYCDCFATGVYCLDCRCMDCLNTAISEPKRSQAITAILNKRPNAIRCKQIIKNPTLGGSKADLTNKGCNCKKTRCVKKYCVCFHAGIKCGEHCQCIGCLNGAPHGQGSGLQQSEQKISDVLVSMSSTQG